MSKLTYAEIRTHVAETGKKLTLSHVKVMREALMMSDLSETRKAIETEFLNTLERTFK